MQSKKQIINRDESTLSIIQKIKSGDINPIILKKEQRQQCVEALFLEGLNTAAINEILKVNERTIRRDLCDIRERNALTPSPDLVRQLVGDFMMSGSAHCRHLMKLARKEGSIGEKAQAEYYAHLVKRDMMLMLQSLGYLPKAADTVTIEHYLGKDNPKGTIDVLAEELADMEALETSQPKKKTLAKIKEQLKQENDNDTETK